MSNTENSISQLIRDQQLLSAYRNGVVNAQLRSLYPSASALLSADERVSSSLTDNYVFQALMPSMTPQEQLLTRLELMKRTALPLSPLYAPSVPSSSISDIIRVLENNNNLNNALLLNNSRSSILASESSLIHDEQLRLGSLLPSGFGSLLPSCNPILSNSFNNIIEENNRQNLSIELLNALAVAAIGIPIDDERNIASNALDLIHKRQADSSLASEQTKKKARTTKTNRFAITTEQSRSRKKKRSKPIHKSEKELAPGSKTSATYEDAQLLFDTFVTLASGEKTALNTCSTVSVDSEGSILKYEDFAANSELTSPEFWDKVPHVLTISMAQMSLAVLKPNDKQKTTELGHAALCCKHCKGVIGFGSHFFKSLRQGNHIHRIMKHVQTNCTACPIKVRNTVQKLCSPINSDSLGLTLSKSIKANAFFERIWNQLCIAGFIDDKTKSDTDADTVVTDAASDDIVTE